MLVPGTAMTAAPAARIAPMEIVAAGGEAQVQSPFGYSAHERIHLHARALNVLAGREALVAGSLRPRLGGANVSLQLLFGRRWVTVAHAHTGAHGRFRLRYMPRRVGSWPAQVRYRGAGAASGAARRLGALSAFRPAAASWYGGGGGLACGGQLTSATMGVANRTLPCGTWLTLRYRGRSVRVQVIDRGPYVAGREFDLTEATKQALGFEGVGVVWSTR